MSRLLANSMPAERHQSCVFAEQFTNATEIVANSGTITGTPTYENNGAVLSGSDYITFDVSSSNFSSDGFSVVLEVIPDFNGADGLAHYFFDTEAGEEYSLYKKADDDLALTLGGVLFTIPYATWSANYRQGQINCIVIGAQTGNTNMWFNGVKILDSDATAWTSRTPTVLKLGVDKANANSAGGNYRVFKQFRNRLRGLDAAAYEDKTIFNYDQYLRAYWPMRTVDDKTTYTEDTVNGYRMTLYGDVTKSSGRRGYEFGGTNGHLRCDAAGLSFGHDTYDDPMTVVGLFRTNRGTATPYINKGFNGWNSSNVRMGSIGNGKIIAYYYDLSTGGFEGVLTVDETNRVGTWFVLGATYDGVSGNPRYKSLLYMNGIRATDTNTASGSYTAMEDLDPSNYPLCIGRIFNQYLDGSCGGVMMFDKELGDIQMADVYFRLRKNLENDY